MAPLRTTGTARLQLVHKGDITYTYTDLANILPIGGILSIGLIAWLLDKKVRAAGLGSGIGFWTTCLRPVKLVVCSPRTHQRKYFM